MENIDKDTYTIPENIPSAYSWVDSSSFCRIETEEETYSLCFPLKWHEFSTQTLYCSNIQNVPPKIKLVTAFATTINTVSEGLRHFTGELILDWATANDNRDFTRTLSPEMATVLSIYQQPSNIHVSHSLMKKRKELPLSSLMSPSAGLLVWLDTPVVLDE